MALPLPLLLALLLTVGWLCQWIAWHTRQPAIVFLLSLGILLGPVTGWLNPDLMFGDALFHIVSLGVAIILFEGSLTLHVSDAKGVSTIIRNLITIGVLITMCIMAVAAHYLANLQWSTAFLFGALMSVTGPTVIAPMLRSMQPTPRIASILRWEGILIDPIGALLAVLVYEAIITGQQGHSLLMFFEVILAGSVCGAIGAFLVGLPLKRHWVPAYLQNYFVLAAVLLCFTASNEWSHESGLLSVTLMGMILANQKNLSLESILDFKEHLSVLIISMLFIVLAARIDFEFMLSLWAVCLGLLLVAQFIARPLSVLISSIGTSISFKEGLLLSWVAPRGIVAAAVSALFALRLEEAGNTEALALVPLSFAIIIGTVVLQGSTGRSVAKLLGLSAADSQGVLISGINPVSLAVTEALKKQEIPVLLTDERWYSVNDARMVGYDAWYGNVLSERAEHELELTGMKWLFTASRSMEVNTLVSTRYRPEFGHTNILMLGASSPERDAEHRGVASALRVPALGNKELTWGKFSSLLSQGWVIKTTRLSDEFNYQQYREKQHDNMIPLLAITPRGELKVFSSNNQPEPDEDWRVLALLKSEP